MLIKNFLIPLLSIWGIRAYPRVAMMVTKRLFSWNNCITFTPYFDDEYEERLLEKQKIEKCNLENDIFQRLDQSEILIKLDYQLRNTKVKNSEYYFAPRINSGKNDVIYFWPIMLRDITCNENEYFGVDLIKIDFEVEIKYNEFKEPYKEDIFHSYWTFYCVKGKRLSKSGVPLEKMEPKQDFPSFYYDVVKDREKMLEKEKEERIAQENDAKKTEEEINTPQEKTEKEETTEEDLDSLFEEASLMFNDPTPLNLTGMSDQETYESRTISPKIGKSSII
jgi:hypothetical protein